MSADDKTSSGTSSGPSGGGGGGGDGGGGGGEGGKSGRKRPPRRRPRRRRKPAGGGEGGGGEGGGSKPQGGGKQGGGKQEGGGKPGGGKGRSRRRRRKRPAGDQGSGKQGGGKQQAQGGKEGSKSRGRRRKGGGQQEGGGRQGSGKPREGRRDEPRVRTGGAGRRPDRRPGQPAVRDGARPGEAPKHKRPIEERMEWPPVVRTDPEDDTAELDWAEEQDPKERDATLYNMVQVRFRDGQQVSRFDAGEHMVEPGDEVVLETEQGLMVGVAVKRSTRTLVNHSLPRMIRPLDHGGLRQQARNRSREEEAFEYCSERIAARKLPMKLIRVIYLHGGNKAIFFFASENRVDFRELVKDLAKRFHTRIVMRQVGVRDESKMTGGIGSCGCELCCATWLPRFEPVSIRMAKDQGMVLNPQKVSGQCGRLKCCLGYELAQYLECRKGLPKMGRKVTTPGGVGRVVELDILRRRVRVLSPDGNSTTLPASDVKPLLQPPPRPKDNDRG